MGWELTLTVAMLWVPSDTLRLTVVGNAGVLMTDESTSLLVDLPYRSGAFGYDHYRPEDLDPPGRVLSVVTHNHADHFDPDLFSARDGWDVIGPRTVTSAVPAERVLHGDSIRVGDFDVIAIPTPHTPDHRSYRIRWRDKIVHFAGDTESPAQLAAGPRADVLFITPWLACTVVDLGLRDLAERTLGYHLQRHGEDPLCGELDILPQGSSVVLVGEGPR